MFNMHLLYGNRLKQCIIN